MKNLTDFGKRWTPVWIRACGQCPRLNLFNLLHNSKGAFRRMGMTSRKN